MNTLVFDLVAAVTNRWFIVGWIVVCALVWLYFAFAKRR